MSLTNQDISKIRDIVLDAIEVAVSPRFDALEEDVAGIKTDVAILKTDVSELKTDVAVLKSDVATLKSDVIDLKTGMRQVKGSLSSLEGKVEALEADVKEIYQMLAEQQKRDTPSKQFSKLTIEEKLLKLNDELLAAAKEAGISLPR